MITVRHNERKSACNVAANEQNGRERFALMNSLQILVHVRLVTREKREMRGAQQVLRGRTSLELRTPGRGHAPWARQTRYEVVFARRRIMSL